MSNALSRVFFLAIALLVWYLMSLAQHSRRWQFVLLSVMVLTGVAGLRGPSVGVDTQNNIEIFRLCYAAVQRHALLPTSKEYIYYELAGQIMRLKEDPNLVFGVYGFFIYGLIFARLWDFRQDIDLGSAGLFFVLFSFGSSMNGLRQFISIALVFYGSRYLADRRYIFYFLFAALAVCFHTSALVTFGLPALYIGPRRYYKVKEFVLLLCTAAAVLPMLIYLRRHYDGYSTQTGDVGKIKYIRLLITLVIGYVYKSTYSAPLRLGSDVCLDKAFVTPYFTILMLGLLLGFAGSIASSANRIAYYFRLFELIVYPRFFYSPYINRHTKAICFGALTALGVFILFTYNGIIPYKTCLWTD